jgi:ankyrin repeat protein
MKRFPRWPILLGLIPAAYVACIGSVRYASHRHTRLDAALMNAVRKEGREVVERLLQSGANPNAEDAPIPLNPLPWWSSKGLLALLCGQDTATVYGVTGESALLAAIQRGDLAIVKCLIDHGATVNPEGTILHHDSPLMRAAEHGRLDVARCILEAGANPNARSGVNPGPAPALHRAVGHNDAAMVRLLLQHGADPNIGYKRMGDCLWAAKANKQEVIVRLLLDAGARQDLGFP